jgi:hypothetical protein
MAIYFTVITYKVQDDVLSLLAQLSAKEKMTRQQSIVLLDSVSEASTATTTTAVGKKKN